MSKACLEQLLIQHLHVVVVIRESNLVRIQRQDLITNHDMNQL
jgi:hypothetical protein